MKVIAIIGFGFCGRLVFYHLAKRSDKNTKILIFEKEGSQALGPAFSSFSPHYVLNVPTQNMSAFSDKPDDFCKFLEIKYPKIFKKIGKNGFAPRQIYGEYIEKLTNEAFEIAKKNSIEFEFVAEEVIEIQKEFLLKTKNNKSYQANEIALATSFVQSDLPDVFNIKNSLKKLWNDDAKNFHEKIFNNEKICLIGCGLTAVDVLVGLSNKNFTGKIFAISRHGNFPKKHLPNSAEKISAVISAQDAKKGVLFLCLKIRKFLRANPQYDLRQVVDSIRETTKEIWHNFDEKNKNIFLKKLCCYWNIFRHRAPISSIEIIEKMIAEKQLEIVKKSLPKSDFDYVVNCLGFELRAEKYPLLNQMINANLLKKDVLLAQSNHPKIHLLGGLNIGRDFECTSVPDLRTSVENYLNFSL